MASGPVYGVGSKLWRFYGIGFYIGLGREVSMSTDNFFQVSIFIQIILMISVISEEMSMPVL